MARRAELAVLSGRGDLAQHVLVEVALGVAILHRDIGEEIDHLGQQRRRRDREARALHVRRVRGALLGHGAQEGEYVLGDDLEHRGRLAVFQPRPAHVLIGDATLLADAVLAIGEDAPLHRLLQPIGSIFFPRVDFVEPAQEQEVGDLLDDLDRIGDAARPEGVPDRVDFRAKFPRQHHVPSLILADTVLGQLRGRYQRASLAVDELKSPQVRAKLHAVSWTGRWSRWAWAIYRCCALHLRHRFFWARLILARPSLERGPVLAPPWLAHLPPAPLPFRLHG